MKRKLIWILLVYIGVSIAMIGIIPRKINWSDFFIEKSKDPYGLYIFKDIVTSMFDHVEWRDQALYELEDEWEESENYIFVTDEIQFSKDERTQLLEWVSNGNNAFIAAKDFSTKLLDTLNLKADYLSLYFFANDEENDLKVQSVQSQKKYEFSKQYSVKSLDNKYDSLQVYFPIAVSFSQRNFENNKPIVIQVKHGKGNFYLCTLPYVFTNFYLMHQDNYEFAEDILSFLPNTRTYYDTYYKSQTSKKPPLSVFLNTTAFRWAGAFGGTLLLLHILFSIKRKQKYIPIIKPPENRSLEFTKTIGDLYYSTYDLADLMVKMERHFKEYVKQKYRIADYQGTEKQTQLLMAKSGKKIGLISSINSIFRQFRKTQHADEKSIIILNKKLQQFYDRR